MEELWKSLEKLHRRSADSASQDQSRLSIYYIDLSLWSSSGQLHGETLRCKGIWKANGLSWKRMSLKWNTHTHTKRTALPSSQVTMQKRVCNTDSYDRRPLRSQTDLTWKHGDVVCELFEKEMELTWTNVVTRSKPSALKTWGTTPNFRLSRVLVDASGLRTLQQHDSEMIKDIWMPKLLYVL